MRIDCKKRTSLIAVVRIAVCFAVVWLIPTSRLTAQVGVMRIEEDWELELIQPDAQLDAPQVLLVLSPLGEGSDVHFEVDINHASLPSYYSGGLQIRAMQGAECVEQKRLLDGQRLTVESDVIRWTQIVEKQPTGFAFGISNGTSLSWGAFGDAASHVTLSGNSGAFNYSPANSLSRSGVTYAGNRVKQLTLRKVRYVDLTGNTTEIDVNQAVQ